MSQCLMSRHQFFHDHLYTSLSDADHCVYCGDPFDCWDHTVSRAYVEKLVEIMTIETPMYLVQSCMECNGVLSDRIFDTFLERFIHVKRRLIQRYPVNTIHWTEEELNWLDGRLKQYVETMQWAVERNSRTNQKRIQWRINQNLESALLADLSLRPRGKMVLSPEDSAVKNADRGGIMENASNCSSKRKQRGEICDCFGGLRTLSKVCVGC